MTTQPTHELQVSPRARRTIVPTGKFDSEAKTLQLGTQARVAPVSGAWVTYAYARSVVDRANRRIAALRALVGGYDGRITALKHENSRLQNELKLKKVELEHTKSISRVNVRGNDVVHKENIQLKCQLKYVRDKLKFYRTGTYPVEYQKLPEYEKPACNSGKRWTEADKEEFLYHLFTTSFMGKMKWEIVADRMGRTQLACRMMYVRMVIAGEV